MNRFRKRSDAKRSQVPDLQHTHEKDAQNILPELPSANDFRTSLILPDLSRRFSLLRSSTGDPVSLEHLRTRLANQRARGAQNQITEEEEDMLLETLGKLRSTKTPSPAASQEHVAETDDSTTVTRTSIRSTATSSSVTSSPNSRSKRYSNNLFGSGRLRDYNYLKSVASSKASINSTRALSLTPTEVSTSAREASNTSIRPVTPENSIPSSVQSSPSPNEDGLVHSAPHIPPAPFGDNAPISVAEYRLQKALGPSVLRASMALEEAIKEIEDEVEDEILLPRSVPVPRSSLDQPTAEVQRESQVSNNSALYEAAMAISIDQTIHSEFSERRQSPIPARTVPGYIPGMPRPMTPRDFDFDEQRSHSTTPRAQSPYTESSPLSNSASSKVRRESISSVTARSTPITPVAAAPLFLQRSTNGRYTPDDSQRASGGDSVEFDSPLNSSILGRRRPASPLSGPSYQPMTAVTNRPPSRPTTPSNVIWTPSVNSSNGHRNNRSGHGRNNSLTTEGPALDSDYLRFDRHHQLGPRSLKSPAFPDSPTLDPTASYSSNFANNILSNGSMISAERPQAYIPEVELGSPILGATLVPRSATPTQTAQRSPISPSFSSFDLSPRNISRRSSRQNPPSSPFNIGPFPSLGLSPRANSSRSSLNSVGSSFHSWDEPDKVFSVFSDAKDQQAIAWHDLDKELNSILPGQGSLDDDEWDPEEIIERYAGLKKADIAAVQEKLVAAAFAKIANTDPRDRAPSALRRRRPSTSQSNYRVASPPPQMQTPASPSYVVDDKLSKASALLNSVVDSINERPSTPTVNVNAAVSNLTLEDLEVSPNTRRNRDLAHVLFGNDEDGKEEEEPAGPAPEQPKPDPVFSPPAPIAISTSESVTTESPSLTTSVPVSPTQPNAIRSPSFNSPYLLLRNPSTPKIPPTPQEQAELARAVQEKTDAAMLALNKNPSRTNLGDGLKQVPSVRRKVDTSQISTPKLLSTTTSVETIPLRTPSLLSNNTSSPGASKLGSRFKKLRGSLRAKNIASSGEETVTPDTSKSPLASQTAFYDPAKINPPGAPKLSSATETGRFKVPVPSPPASAGPGLKGFMARFRNKQRMSENSSSGENPFPGTSLPLSPTSSLTPRQVEPTTPKQMSPTDRSHTSTPRPAGQPRPMYSRFPPANPPVAPSPPQPTHTKEPMKSPAETTQLSDAALEQFFAAASNIGLDENVINALLARSGSTSSRNLLARNNSVAKPQPTRQNDSKVDAEPVAYVGSTGSDQTATPTSYIVPPEQQLQPPSKSELRPATPEDVTVTRKPSARRTDQLRRPKEGQAENAGNAIVRRTILIASDLSPSDFTALSALTQRKTSMRKKRASATSVSSRSVHDRAPTPPPPKSPTIKRFSADGMPPIPQMPNFVGQAGKMLNAPSTSAAGPIEKSNSTYDSLYDMYAGESRAASAAPNDSNSLVDQAASKGEYLAASDGPALEIIQLANGETIWNIVNGLRDGDDESIYSGRASFASEYSTREPGNDGLQAFMKEHARSGSKGSISSFVSKKKPQGKNRPETNVFYSSSAQIGRLIESLSQGADAGSFNIIPNRGPGHSNSSSLSTNDINWTVEERLEHMLGSMNNAP
ncbi:hypothetical protein JR316_0003471 [Psilocybe cubensis]|uniref:Uncharacterized protein n=2 Tax=Psilocybe cubensis TaxID=181762 RepID=A0A8H7Y4N5_PSICU|nr:hypothetical protein JR316_0003471 [Psilocybe cubensis]KAH9483993.1 hypothetical protein JR316_0003471 [Psilocybe cubensis]